MADCLTEFANRSARNAGCRSCRRPSRSLVMSTALTAAALALAAFREAGAQSPTGGP